MVDDLKVPGWIDVHCHFYPPNPEADEIRHRAMCCLGFQRDTPFRWSLEGTLDYMDRRGIAMQMLSNIPSDLATLKESNDYAAGLIRQYPTRFGLLVAVPTDDCTAALAEVERATSDLHADGFAVTCCYKGVYLSDTTLEPLWAELNRQSAVVFVHPNAYVDASFGRPAALLEVAFETARTIVDMFYKGVFKRYPDIKFVVAHCGGALPALSGRLSLLGTQPWVPNPESLTQDDFISQMNNLYLDTAATAAPHSLSAGLSMVPADHLVYGSDSGVPCSTECTLDANLQSLLESPLLTTRQIQDSGTTNLFKLFPSAAARLRMRYGPSVTEEECIVHTPSGKLQGSIEDGTRIFRGIPYAQPPIGSRRFRPPSPMTWDGVRDARQSGPASYQINHANMENVKSLVKKLDPGVPGIMSWPGYTAKTYNQETVSEDCLYMDIWVPEVKTEQKLPVYIYYHGGANAVSSGSFHLERGANLAKEENIIVVRPNYRLGALGWVHFGLISDQFPEATNLGLQDQIAALYWVYDNITSFGGDPENITVGGESAGATAVSHLLIYPGTQRLIRRAIIQSLSPFNLWCTQRKDEAVVVARRYMELLQIDDPAQLSDIDADKLLAVHNILIRQFDADANVSWSPVGGVVDGLFIPELPALALSERPYPRQDFELMIGFAKDEWQFFRGHSETIQSGSESQAISVLAQVFGTQNAESLFKEYQTMHPGRSPGHLLGDSMSMEFFKFASLKIAQNSAAQGFPVFVFQFSFDLPGLGGYLRAVHTGDIPFIFRNFSDEDLRMWPSFDGIDKDALAKTSADFGSFYGSFIRGANPGSGWPLFDSENQAILWLGENVLATKQLLKRELEAFEKAGVSELRDLHARLLVNTRRAINAL